jgi:DnaJ family protein C protein 28
MDEERDRGEPPLEKWESLVEQRIQEAMARGDFDGLPGEGKPLNLSRNPFADPTLEAAWRLLQNAGFSLEWIEEDKEIRRDLKAARERLRRAWELRLEWEGKGAEAAWERAVSRFREEVEQINARIDLHNLKVPSVHFQRLRVLVEEEIARVQEKRG